MHGLYLQKIYRRISQQISTETSLFVKPVVLVELLMETMARVCGQKTLVQRQITIRRHGGM